MSMREDNPAPAYLDGALHSLLPLLFCTLFVYRQTNGSMPIALVSFCSSALKSIKRYYPSFLCIQFIPHLSRLGMLKDATVDGKIEELGKVAMLHLSRTIVTKRYIHYRR